MSKSWKRPNMDRSREGAAEMIEGVPLFRPQAGKHGKWGSQWVRILPPPADHPYEEFFYWAAIHFMGTGQPPILCTKRMFYKYGEETKLNPRCLICERVGGADGRDGGDRHSARWVALMNVVVYNDKDEPEGKVYLWAATKTVLEEIMDAIEELPAKKRDITDPETGRRVKVSRKGTGVKDTRYRAELESKASALELPELLESLFDLVAHYPVLPETQIAALLAPAKDPFEDEDEDEEEKPKRLSKGRKPPKEDDDDEEDDNVQEGEYRKLDDDEEEEDDEDDDDEEEEEPKPKASKKPKSGKSKKPESKKSLREELRRAARS